MSVKRRGDSWQTDFVFRGLRYRKCCKDCNSREQAQEFEDNLRSKLRMGEPIDDTGKAGSLTIKQLMLKTYERFWKDQKAGEKTLGNAEVVASILGENRVAKHVTTATIEGLIGELKAKKYSNGTINRKLAALSKMLHYGQQLGVVDKMPYIGRQREGDGRIRWLTDAEEVALLNRLAHLGRDDLRDLVVFLLDVGCRLSEALGSADGQLTPLRWKDVDLTAPHVHFWDTKADKPRTIPLTDRVVETLRRRKLKCPTDSDRVFWNLDYWMAQHQFQHVRRSLDMDHDEQYVLHMLRHTFCSRLVQRGQPIQVVQQLAGHKTLAVTLRYAHLRQDNLVEAIRGKPADKGKMYA